MSAKFCTVTASTKRNADLGGNRKGAPVAHLTSLRITPLWPLSGDTVRLLDLNSPREMKECYHVPSGTAVLPDVKERDILTVNGTDYPIEYVSEWTDNAIPCLHIVVGEVKRAT